MPLIGLVDPTHRERDDDAPGRWPRWTSVDAILQEAYTAPPKWSPWPYELIAALMNEHQERDYVSTSAVTGGCMRGTIIERKEPYIGTLDNAYAALRGTLIHRTLESAARPGSLAEWRFWTTVDGIELSCSPDLITPEPVALWDYKTTETPPAFSKPYRHHTEQVQFNRFVVNNAERWADADGDESAEIPIDPRNLDFEHVVLVYLGPKWPKVIEVTKSVPQTAKNGRAYNRLHPDVWTDDQVLAELRPRLHAWELAMDAYPEWPDGLESYPGWAGPADWRCPGPPICRLPNCMAKRWPASLVWESPR